MCRHNLTYQAVAKCFSSVALSHVPFPRFPHFRGRHLPTVKVGIQLMAASRCDQLDTADCSSSPGSPSSFGQKVLGLTLWTVSRSNRQQVMFPRPDSQLMPVSALTIGRLSPVVLLQLGLRRLFELTRRNCGTTPLQSCLLVCGRRGVGRGPARPPCGQQQRGTCRRLVRWPSVWTWYHSLFGSIGLVDTEIPTIVDENGQHSHASDATKQCVIAAHDFATPASSGLSQSH